MPLVERPRPVATVILAAGYGTRLRPYTESWPKCLMPVNGRPLLEYWLGAAKQIGSSTVLVNTHHLAETVQDFLERPIFNKWVRSAYESRLEGTAGTIRANLRELRGFTTLLVHADNFCICDLRSFLEFHQILRPKHCLITMMTFHSRNPSACGVVELDKSGVVVNFHEKVRRPPGNLANGAVYLLEPEVLEWIDDHPRVKDFSTEVIPEFIGRIVTWHNNDTHIDIGSIEALREAQGVGRLEVTALGDTSDYWSREFMKHPIHNQISGYVTTGN